jgi:UDP-N-acetylglucosamine 2-epimerase
MQRHPEIEPILVHTGQHYDEKLSDIFFRQMGIPAPHVNLEVGSGSHAVQTAEILKRIEPLLIERKPDLVLVVGDVNSTIAASLAAVKLGIQVAHVEAGLRSFDRSMPEEINRILTDALADYLFVTEEGAIQHLLREGRPREAIHFVGNVMIDSLQHFLPLAQQSTIGDEIDLYGAVWRRFAVLTLHRPSNVDSSEKLTHLLGSRGYRFRGQRSTSYFSSSSAHQAETHTGRNCTPCKPSCYSACRVSRFSLPSQQSHAGPNRFRRHPGRNHRSRRPVPNAARKH